MYFPTDRRIEERDFYFLGKGVISPVFYRTSLMAAYHFCSVVKCHKQE